MGASLPGAYVFKGRAFLVFAHTSPEAPREMRDAGEIHIHKDLPFHCCLWLLLFRGREIRCGKCSSSSCRPTASLVGSARSARRSVMPSTKRTMA